MGGLLRPLNLLQKRTGKDRVLAVRTTFNSAARIAFIWNVMILILAALHCAAIGAGEEAPGLVSRSVDELYGVCTGASSRLPFVGEALPLLNSATNRYLRAKASLILRLPNTAWNDFRKLAFEDPKGRYSVEEIPRLDHAISKLRVLLFTSLEDYRGEIRKAARRDVIWPAKRESPPDMGDAIKVEVGSELWGREDVENSLAFFLFVFMDVLPIEFATVSGDQVVLSLRNSVSVDVVARIDATAVCTKMPAGVGIDRRLERHEELVLRLIQSVAK